jgi:hypothetical protein
LVKPKPALCVSPRFARLRAEKLPKKLPTS